MVRRFFTVLVIVIGALSLVASDVQVSFAQWWQQDQKGKNKGSWWKPDQRKSKSNDFFGRLFAPRKPSDSQTFRPFSPFGAKKSKTVRAKKSAPPGPRRPGVNEAPTETIVVEPKDAKARKILVVGDFAADALAWGLDQTLAHETKLAVVNKANGASGIVRPDKYDWNKQLTEILNTQTPDIVVAMFGSNDRQQIKTRNEHLTIRSDSWEKAYVVRLDGIVDTLKVYGRPFFWVSAPPMRAPEVSADMAYLNGLYESRAEAAGGSFIDIWDGFTSQDGQYIASGPDADGQTRALRTPDGVNFTRAGRLKLSFYVEREVRQKIGNGFGTVDLLASISNQSQIEVGPDGEKRLVGRVISLSDPLPGSSETLAGAPEPLAYDPTTGEIKHTSSQPTSAAPPREETVRDRVIIKGKSVPAVVGRVDDFAWPPRRWEPAAPAPVATGETVVTPDAATAADE